jgi:hypothetical protein
MSTPASIWSFATSACRAHASLPGSESQENMPAEIRQQLEALDDEWHQQHNRFSEQQKCLFIPASGWEELKPACRTSARRLNRRAAMTLDMLNVMLAVSEEGMIEEMLLALLASPQLAVFFEKFPPEKHRRRYSALAGSRSRPLKRDNPAGSGRRSTNLSAGSAALHLAVYRPAAADPGKLHQLTPLLPPRRRSWWMTMPPLPRRCIRCFYSAGA